ncbi:MAG: PAS domain S-box protein [Candidatus Omnitrophota bacterium]
MADTIDYTKLWSPVFDNMKEFIFFIDKDFNIRLVNKSFADFTGKQKSYFIGKKCYEVMHAAKEPIKICPHRKSMVNGKFANEEFFEPSINKWLWVAVTPVFDELGNILGSLHVTTDMTEYKKSSLAASRLSFIVESSDDAIIGKTLDGTITSWNKGAEKMYGYSADEVVGKPVSILIPSDKRDEMSDLFEKIKHGESVTHFETQRIRKNGQKIVVSVTISPIKDDSGTIVGASTIARDITEQRAIQTELKKKISSLERFQRVTVDRELRMKELKTRIAELEAKLGKDKA